MVDLPVSGKFSLPQTAPAAACTGNLLLHLPEFTTVRLEQATPVDSVSSLASSLLSAKSLAPGNALALTGESARMKLGGLTQVPPSHPGVVTKSP